MPLLSQEALELAVPTDRTVRTAFRKATTTTSSLLPLRRVTKLCKALGLPLDKGWMTRGANSRDIDPRGEGAVTESEFMGWWGRHCARKRAEHEQAAVAAAALRHMEAERARAQESMRDGDETVRGPAPGERWDDDGGEEDGTTNAGRSLNGSTTAGLQNTIRELSKLTRQTANLRNGLHADPSLPSVDALPSRPNTVLTMEYDAASLVSGRQRPLRKQRAVSPTPGPDQQRSMETLGTDLPDKQQQLQYSIDDAAEAAEAAAAEAASLAGFSWVRKYRPGAAPEDKAQPAPVKQQPAAARGVTTWRVGHGAEEDAEAKASAGASGDLAGFLSSPPRGKTSRQGEEPWPAAASGEAKSAGRGGQAGMGLCGLRCRGA
jgi:hypothetical protein